MLSMYETIMELPLFKGIGVDQVSSMLSKTSIEFLNFNEGEVIIRPNDKADSVNFILKGKVTVTHTLSNLKIDIVETAGEGRVIGALRLFGLNTDYSCLIKAKSKVSVMRIGKEQYFNLLFTDKIYILNLLNYISAATQKPVDRIIRLTDCSILSRLSMLASVFTSSKSDSVSLIASDEALADFCSVDPSEFRLWKNTECQTGSVLVTDVGITFKSLPYNFFK